MMSHALQLRFLSSNVALLTPEQASAADRAMVAQGGRAADLMEKAGEAVAVAVGARWTMRPVIVLCGPGGNGGDGFVAARHLLQAGWPVRLALLGEMDALSGDVASAAKRWTGEVEPMSDACLVGAEIVVDALFGAGLSRPIQGIARMAIEAVKLRKMKTCAVDVPSGIDGATGEILGAAAPADLTVTFFRKKTGHLLNPGRAFCGEIVVADIGIPSSVLEGLAVETWENGPDLWITQLPWPTAEGHKYTRGEVLVLGGEEMTGASRMTAAAALRAGAGIVTLAAPASVWSIYAGALTGVIVRRFDGLAGFADLLADARRNVIAVGPGAGVGEATRRYVLAALATGRGAVLDADALTSFAEAPEQLFRAIHGPCVLTPHEGEFMRLFHDTGDKLKRARAAAALCSAVVLLKGADTVIAAPDGRAIINSNAPAQLATGGSGDVLTGFVAGLMAQGMAPFEAAAGAAWLHGAAAQQYGLGLVAEDLPLALPQVFRSLRTLLSQEGKK